MQVCAESQQVCYKLSPEQEAVEICQHGPVWVLFAQLEV